MSNSDDRKTEPDENGNDEKVGYGNPPKHSRFKPGRSGHREGRRQGAMGRKGIVEKIAYEVHRVSEGGKTRLCTTLELVVITVRDLAINGNVRAHDEVHRLSKIYGAQEPDRSAGYLVVPEPIPMAEWERHAQEVQAKQEYLS